MGIYVGFDPGGSDAFGWAILSGDTFPLHLVGRGIASHAQGAFEAAFNCAGSKVDAIGIDAPLFWNPSGDRVVDQRVRKASTKLGCPSPTVNAVNSLRGACLIQGVLIAMICRVQLGQAIRITEAHPKALLWLERQATLLRSPADIALGDLCKYVIGSRVGGASDHERDAALGAITAFAMDRQLAGWQDLYPLERNSISPLDPPANYWMPC